MMAVILIAEDDATSMKMLSLLVQSMGHTPIKCRDGAAAWTFLQDNHDMVDIVVTDLMMPEIDGYGLIARMQEGGGTKKIPIIVQSAYLGVKGTHKLMELGASAVLPKPIDAGYLTEHIRHHVGAPSEPPTASKPPAEKPAEA